MGYAGAQRDSGELEAGRQGWGEGPAPEARDREGPRRLPICISPRATPCSRVPRQLTFVFGFYDLLIDLQRNEDVITGRQGNDPRNALRSQNHKSVPTL